MTLSLRGRGVSLLLSLFVVASAILLVGCGEKIVQPKTSSGPTITIIYFNDQTYGRFIAGAAKNLDTAFTMPASPAESRYGITVFRRSASTWTAVHYTDDQVTQPVWSAHVMAASWYRELYSLPADSALVLLVDRVTYPSPEQTVAPTALPGVLDIGKIAIPSP